MISVEMEKWKIIGKFDLEIIKLDDWIKWIGYFRDLYFFMKSKRFVD